jgi:hypothetical protein
MCNHTKIFREINVTNILKSNNTVGFPSLIPIVSFNVTYGNATSDVSGNDNIEDDENLAFCPSGVMNKIVCCLASCGTCGGSQCGSRQGGAVNCCQTQIVSSNRSCDEFEPPCIF